MKTNLYVENYDKEQSIVMTSVHPVIDNNVNCNNNSVYFIYTIFI